MVSFIEFLGELSDLLELIWDVLKGIFKFFRKLYERSISLITNRSN